MPHLRGKEVRMALKKWFPGGRKRSPRGVKFRPPGGPKTVVSGLWRPPGASWAAGAAQEGVLSGKERHKTFAEDLTRFGPEGPANFWNESLGSPTHCSRNS